MKKEIEKSAKTFRPIELAEDNIERWKDLLDYYMLKRLKLVNYSSTCSDSEWLEMFEGQTAKDVYIDFCTTD